MYLLAPDFSAIACVLVEVFYILARFKLTHNRPLLTGEITLFAVLILLGPEFKIQIGQLW
jgi:hypothetical protein